MTRLLKQVLKFIRPSDSSLDGAIQHVLVPGAIDTRLKKGSPWRPFPNVKDFKVELSPLDEVFAKFGLKKRLDKATMVYTTYKNRDLNRYVEHQIMRLKAADDRTFGTIALALMRRSNVGFLLGLKHVVPNWHRNMNFGMVLDLRKKYRKLTSGDIDLNLDYKRVYILKANKKWRPLGVPKLVGRVYLHNLNQFLVCRLNDRILSSQHGFRPGLGTLTAGKEILSKVKDAKYVYEYDYQAFFPNVEITYISKILRRYGVIPRVVELIENINKSQPKLAVEDKVDESKVRQFNDLSRWLTTGETPSGPSWDIIKERIVDTFGTADVRESPLLQECLLEGIPEYWSLEDLRYNPESVLLKYVEVQGALLASYGIGNFMTMLRGVPQGAPTSPFLSILAEDAAVRPSLPKHVSRIAYADDGILYSDQPFSVEPSEEMQEAGIEYSPEKSRWVKVSGEWITPLKFLGLKGDGETFSAETRNGSKLIYDKASLLEAIEAGYINGGRNSASNRMKGDTGEQFVKSKYAGGIQSRLYNGSGNQDKFWQNFELRFHTGSWVGGYLKWVKQPQRWDRHKAALAESLTIFNSSSIALRSALEAFRIQDGLKAKKPFRMGVRPPVEENLAKNLEKDAEQESLTKRDLGGKKRDYSVWNQRRGMMGYCSSPAGFNSFITKELLRMAPYSKFSFEESWDHYQLKYLIRKGRQVEHVLEKGRRLIAEVRFALKNIQ